MIVANSVISDILTSLKAAMGLLDGATLALLQGSIPSGPAPALSDFTVADFSGYAPATVASAAWIGPSTTAQGSTYVETPAEVFTADDPLVVPNTITGWLLHDGTNPIAWAQIAAPVLVDRAGQIVRASGAVAAGNTQETVGGVWSA